MNLRTRLTKLELGQQPAQRWVPTPEIVEVDERDPQSVAASEARCAAIEGDLASHGYERQAGDPPAVVLVCLSRGGLDAGGL